MLNAAAGIVVGLFMLGVLTLSSALATALMTLALIVICLGIRAIWLRRQAKLDQDDQRLDQLGSAVPVALPGLEMTLLAWRHEVERDPIPALIDIYSAIDAIEQGKAAAS